jgi:hypothetical protein
MRAAARTPYDRFGDYVPWTATGIAALAAATALLSAGRRRRLVRQPLPLPAGNPAAPLAGPAAGNSAAS